MIHYADITQSIVIQGETYHRRKPPKVKSTEIDRKDTHLAGEYYVGAELYRRGYSVAMTLGNAKAIDLFAERGKHTVNVQVKAIRE